MTLSVKLSFGGSWWQGWGGMTYKLYFAWMPWKLKRGFWWYMPSTPAYGIGSQIYFFGFRLGIDREYGPAFIKLEF